MIAQLVRLARALFAEEPLSCGAVRQPKEGMRNRKIRIDVDSAFEEGDCGVWVVGRSGRSAVRLQRIERCRGRLVQRCRVFPDRRERLANTRSELRRELAQDVQHVFLPRRRELLLVEEISRSTVLGAEADDVLIPEAR